MTVDALRPSGTDPLKLFRSQFRQAQGANDSAVIPLHTPLLQVTLPYQRCHHTPIIVIISRQHSYQRSRYFAAQAYKIQQLYCHTSIF